MKKLINARRILSKYGFSRFSFSRILTIRKIPQKTLFVLFFFSGFIGIFAESARPDLKIVNVTRSSDALYSDEWFKVIVEVRNDGQAVAKNFRVDLFKNKPGSPQVGKRGDLSYLIKRLAPDAILPIEFVYKLLSGSYEVYAVVDSDKKITETSESNNVSQPLSLVVGSSRSDDNYEDNDTVSQAKVLSGGSSSISLVSKDKDYFKIQALAGDYIDLQISFNHTAANLELYLLDVDGNVLSSSESQSNKEKIFYKVPENEPQEGAESSTPEPKDFILLVEPGTSGNSYHLDVKIGSVPDLQVKIDFANAAFVRTKEFKDDSGNKTYLDFYKVEGEVHITNLGAPLTLPANLDIFRNEKNAPKPGDFGDLASFHGECQKTGTAWENRLQSGYLSVAPSLFTEDTEDQTLKAVIPFCFEVVSGVFGVFALIDSDNHIKEFNEHNNVSASVQVVAGENEFVDDRFEADPAKQNDVHPNDLNSSTQNGGTPTVSESKEQYIQRITIGPGSHKNLIALDDDFYAINVGPKQSIDLSIDFMHSLGDLDLYLLDKNNSEIASSTTAGNRETVTYHNESEEAAETLFVRVTPVNGYNPGYHLNLVVLPESEEIDLIVTDIRYAPLQPKQGDTIEVKLSVENKGNHTAKDVRLDLFSLPASSTGPVVGSISERYALLNELTGGQKKEIVIHVPASQGSFKFFAVADTKGTVAETNESNNVFGAVNYTVQAGVQDDELEIVGHTENGTPIENDTPEKAKSLTMATFSGLKALDVDWYVYQLGNGQTLNADISFEHDLGDLDINMYKEVTEYGRVQYVVVSSGISNTNNEKISFKNETGGALAIYIRVYPVNAPNGYTLALSQGEPPQTSGYADLIVDSFVSLPKTPEDGDIIRTTVSVKNIGSSPTEEDTYLDLFLSETTEPAPGVYGDFFEVIGKGMAAGEILYYTFEYSLKQGSYSLYAVVDTDNLVLESKETNNVGGPRTLQVVGSNAANLAISNLNSSTTSGQTGSILTSFTLSNTGKSDVVNPEVRFTLVDSLDVLKANVIADFEPVLIEQTISAGESIENVSATLPLDAYVPAGDFYIRVFVDWQNKVAELNEEDNLVHSTIITIQSQRQEYVLETFSSENTDTVMELYVYTPPVSEDGAAPVAFEAGNVKAEDLTMIRQLDDSSSGKLAKISAGLPKGVYFVRVVGFQGDQGNYSLFVNTSSRTGLESIDPRNPQDYEDNNSSITATKANFGIVQNHSLSSSIDEDWFYFEVQ